MKTTNLTGTVIILFLFLASCGTKTDQAWLDDFRYQKLSERPALEVKYSDSSRTAFQILAEDFELLGQLEKPHLLKDLNSGEEWLWFEVEDENGDVYSSRNSPEASRINLYRRGPYFCEVHWLEIGLATAEEGTAPVKGDLALYCYPDKILGEINWYGVGDFNARTLHIKGISPKTVECTSFQDGSRQTFTFPIMGEEPPLPEEAFQLLEGNIPVYYDGRKGHYVVGTNTMTGGFEDFFFIIPNQYETARFTLKNDTVKRKIYINHKTFVGGGQVEGGAVLDEEGQLMPILVQVSKNFGGEKEEKFYNPLDTAFSETFFPLYLEPGENMTLSTLHLYQNWGRHMTKHWSSLGAWMDYFHSSTGVTETTCYVPFKFAGIGGVSIADFRAMSQETYWSGQPQHDNLAGHSFLSFYDGEVWNHAKYESTIYRSTGNNWYDIQLNYTSADGSIGITADIWETPQEDELRSFFKVRYEVLKPLVIEDAKANFRFLSVTSVIQRLRFTRFAASGIDDMEIDFTKSPFPVKGHPLPSENAYLAEYGDHVRNRGSNAIVIRKFTGPGDIGPAATLQTGPYMNRFHRDGEEDTRLLLVPDVETLELQPGDVFEIDGYWLPYGAPDDAITPRRETELYPSGIPEVVSCAKGTVISHLPVKIKAEGNNAEFTIRGGKDLLPVIVTGLTDWKYPRIWKKEKGNWRHLSHARNNAHDGYQVFCDDEGTYGAVFLVSSDEKEQQLKVTAGKAVGEEEKITVEVSAESAAGGTLPALLLGDKDEGLVFSYPLATQASGLKWKPSEGASLFYESDEGNWNQGGRVTPNQEDIDLEYWWRNHEVGHAPEAPVFSINLEGTGFEDPDGKRTWVLTGDGWAHADMSAGNASTGVIAVQSAGMDKVLCLAWPGAEGAFADGGKEIGISIEPISFPLRKRYLLKGKVYIMEGDLDILRDRISKETGIL